jgi:hypothetical protein
MSFLPARIPLHRAIAWIGLAALAGLAVADAKPPPPVPQVFEMRTFRLEVAPPRGWEAQATPAHGYVLFNYTDKPALTTAATIGLFRIVAPAAVRQSDRLEVARGYATHDLAGVQQALFKSNADLRPLSRRPKAIHGGLLFSFAEPADAENLRVSSSEFVRGWVFFPAEFAQDGILFVLLGRQTTPSNEVRPDELAWAEDIIAGLRPRQAAPAAANPVSG